MAKLTVCAACVAGALRGLATFEVTASKIARSVSRTLSASGELVVIHNLVMTTFSIHSSFPVLNIRVMSKSSRALQAKSALHHITAALEYQGPPS